MITLTLTPLQLAGWLALTLFAAVGLLHICHAILVAGRTSTVPDETASPQPAPERFEHAYWRLPEVPAWDMDTSWRGFGLRADGSEFIGEPTGVLPVVDLAKPEPKPEPVRDGPGPRERFTEPEPPTVLTVTTKVGGQVLTDKVQVSAC